MRALEGCSHFSLKRLSTGLGAYSKAWSAGRCPSPGGPKSRTPFVSLARLPDAKSSGCWSGSWTTSLKASFASFSAPTSAKPAPESSGRTTCDTSHINGRTQPKCQACNATLVKLPSASYSLDCG